ncbi:acyltransferase family protein [Litorihabitans aurantiacus]|uniref:Acyltransferase 3 domain-containing protein n=1 Tax=Litorihabitans aurantiacus TaxID=1930061 RepID=A0AA37XB97_9MICO|nr:acyltransferase family protein [Litorihabitans aurantiacus]GMA30809.1 hypothetical protein GCM10025875_08010 [Litorihabitans aurantiacus]
MTTTLGRMPASPSTPTAHRPPEGPVTRRETRPHPERPTAERAPAPPVPAHRPFAHLRGLDGVRALAVVAVLAYHAGATWLPGGFLGVDVFFVLSGFLITALIGHEVATTGRLDVASFYRRRIARLVPALWTVVAAVAVAGLVWREQLDALRGEILAALTYSSNWWQIATDSSYFSSGGRPPLLRHLWSLALEAQFYLAAPLLAWVLLRWGRRVLGRIALGFALASTALMGAWAVVAEMPVPFDPSRLYFGTDTHLAPIMTGVALACVWRPWRSWPAGSVGSISTASAPSRTSTGTSWLRGSDVTPRWRAGALTDVVGAGALVAVVGVMATATELSSGLYRGGFLSFSLLAAVLVAAAAHPGTLLGRALALPPLRWLGTRSYGIYLWHWPVFVLARPGLDVPGPEWLVQVLRIALVLGVAEMSYRFVEQPVRRGALRRWVTSLRSTTRPRGRRRVAAVALVAVTALALAVAFVPGRTSDVERAWQSAQSRSAPEVSAQGAPAPGPTAPSAGSTTPTPPPDAAPTAPAGATSLAPAPDATARPGPATTEPGAAPAPTPAEVLGSVTAVGDSVLAMVAPDLEALGVSVDAETSRQFRPMVDLVIAARDAGTLGDTVLVHGGTNGPIQEADLRRLLDATTDRRVFLVDVEAPVAWEEPNNELLRRVAAEYPNTAVVDWSATAQAHPQWLYDDAIHPREGEGTAGVAALLWDAIQPD